MKLINRTLKTSLKTFKLGLVPPGAIASSKPMTIYFLICKENHPQKDT